MYNNFRMNPITKSRALEVQPDQLKLTIGNSLIQAIIAGNLKKVRHLLERGANLTSKNDFGFGVLVGALHVADDVKRGRLFRMLLDLGAPCRIKDERHHRSVLHWACLLERLEQVQVFLKENGGDFDPRDRDAEGYTALHYAVFSGSLPIVETLVDYHNRLGVTVDLEDHMGLTPYLHARRLGRRDVANLLYKKGQASIGHGDFLFRTPREWSQIGKFERRMATDLQAAERVNAAKIWGKPIVGNGGDVLPNVTLNSKLRRSSLNRTCVSLPSLGETFSKDVIDGLNDERKGYNKSTTALSKYSSIANSKFVRRSFNNPTSFSDSNIAGFSSSSNNNSESVSHSGSFKASLQQPSNVAISNKSSHSSHAYDVVDGSFPEHKPYPQAHTINTLPHVVRSSLNNPALSLLGQTTSVRGRVANHFHPSQPDKSKENEYRNKLGDLTAIMDILSQQQTKSFRKSVFVKHAETQRAARGKKKVSTFAILFSSEKGGRRRKSLALRSSAHCRKGRKYEEKDSARREGMNSSSTRGKRERSSLTSDKTSRNKNISETDGSFSLMAKDEHLKEISEEETKTLPKIKIN